jgi:hypothetical protein
MTRRLSIAALLASALTACQLGGTTTSSAASDACIPVSGACATDSDCCSFGCAGNVCIANPLPGGTCKTTDDCGYAQTGTYPYVTTTKMTCKSRACTTANVCRDDADVCTTDAQCCNGNCAGMNLGTGHCGPNHPPTVDLGPDRQIASNSTIVVTPAQPVIDPDGDALVYAWALVEKPTTPILSNATLSSTTGATSPSFFADVPGRYVVRLTVTDLPSTPGRVAVVDEVAFTAMNLPPNVNAGADVPRASRNVAFTLIGSVQDPNGTLNPVSCEWFVTPPNGIETSALAFPTCPPSPQITYTTPRSGPEGPWTFRLVATDGVTPAQDDTVVVNVFNDDPIATAPTQRYGNADAPGKAIPGIPLTASATDANGDDVEFVWTWTVDQVPAASAIPVGTVFGNPATGVATSSTSFAPDAEGVYVVKAHVDDAHGGTSEVPVTVTVGPWIRPLPQSVVNASKAPPEIVDVAYDETANRLVLVGIDRSPASGPVYGLWVLDPTSTTTPSAPGNYVALDSEPTCVAISSTGAGAIVGEKGAHWQVITGIGSGTLVKSALLDVPVTPTAVVHMDQRGYAVGYTDSTYTSSAVYGLQLSSTASGTPTGTASPATCSNCTYPSLAGTRAAGRGTALWLLDEPGNVLSRYDVRSNGSNVTLDRSPLTTLTSYASNFWLTSGAGDLVDGNGHVYRAATLTDVSLVLPLSSPDHVHSTGVDAALAGVAADVSATVLTRFQGAMYLTGGTLALPWLGIAGAGYQSHAQAAFVHPTGLTDKPFAYYAIVTATVNGAPWYGIVTYKP